jgi:hypothetical protein
MAPMETQADHVLAPHLDAGERLFWHGRPRQGLRMTAADIILVPVSLLWGGFAFFWEYMVIRQGAPWFFAIWGIPFILVGTYMIAGRFFWDAKRRATTYYGVTDRRVIIRSGIWHPSTRSVHLRSLSDLSMTERADGSGDILLGVAPPMMSWLAGSGWPGLNPYMPPMLEAIPQVRLVHEIIRQRQHQAA